MGNDSTAVRAERNLIRAFQLWSAAAGGQTWEGEGFSCVTNPVPKRAFNCVFVTTPNVGLDQLRDACTQYADSGNPLRVRVRPEIDEGIGTLASIGLTYQGSQPGMWFHGELAPGADTGVRIERVVDQRGLDDMTSLVEECFEWPTEYLRQVYNRALMETPGWYAWVGYAGDEPATTGQMVVHNGTAGLYHVATTARHRSKGYADTNTRVCIEEAQRQGCGMVTLYASPMGYSVYKRIGFQDAGEYLTYGPQ